MTYNTVAHLLADADSNPVPSGAIFHDIHDQIFVCIRFTVLVNGSAVTATDGIYTISNVRENITVTVTVKMPEPPVQDNKPSESGKKKKCGGNVAGNFALLGILTVGLACVLTVRGKKSKLG